VILLASVILIACGTTPTIEPIPCPARPELLQVDPEFDVAPHVQAIVAENYLRLIQYSKKLEARAGCDNDSLA
jgi:hypothetical protein